MSARAASNLRNGKERPTELLPLLSSLWQRWRQLTGDGLNVDAVLARRDGCRFTGFWMCVTNAGHCVGVSNHAPSSYRKTTFAVNLKLYTVAGLKATKKPAQR